MKQMKRSLAVLLTLLMLVSAVPFASFAATCNHVWTSKDYSAAFLKDEANCQRGDVYYYKCTKCGANAKDVADAQDKTFTYGNKNMNNHPEESIVPINTSSQPVCMAPGKTPGKMCALCTTVIEASVDVPMQPHTAKTGAEATCEKQAICKWCSQPFGEKDPDNHPADKLVPIQAETPATCTENGLSAGKRCTACNTTVEPVVVTTKDHEVGTAATCSKRAVCRACNQEFGELDSTKHALQKQKAVPATCAAEGTGEYWKCTDCNKLFSDAQGTTEIQQPPKTNIDPANHGSNLKKVEIVNAKCEEDGMEAHWHCDGCDKYYSDANATTAVTADSLKIPKTGHTWGDWVYPTGYNCEAGGTITRTCTKCDKTETQTTSGHQIVTDAAVQPTCTEAGLKEGQHCKICGTVLVAQEADPAKGHDFAGKATSTGDGKHTVKCTRCDVVSDPVDCTDATFDCKCDVCGAQLAHTFTNYVSNGDATCVKDGTKTAHCDVCNKEDTITDEGSSAGAPHSFEWTELNNATCLTPAQRQGVCRLCGTTILEEIPGTATGHTDSDWQYPEGFDCEMGGIRFRKCIVCGEVTAQETLEGRPHVEYIDPEVPRTCTTDGKTAGSHCDICGEILKAQVILKAEGHRPDENGFVRTKAPTCEETGVDSAKCVVCGQTFTESIPALDHAYADSVVKPTCTAAGYTLHKCLRCGKEYKDNIVKATGHKMVQVVTRATTEKNGKVVMTCSVCGEKQSDVVYRIKTVKLSATSFVRDSKSHKPSVTVKDSKGNKLKKNTDYTLKFSSGRKAVGTYKVKVTFKGNYKGSKTLKFKIVPPAVKNLKVTKGANKATLTWTRNKFADVYVIYRATEKDGKYKKLGSTADLSYTATKLKSGKVYYFKVVAVRKLESGNYYSADSTIRKATIK